MCDEAIHKQQNGDGTVFFDKKDFLLGPYIEQSTSQVANILAFAGVETLCDAVNDPSVKNYYYSFLVKDNRAIASYREKAEDCCRRQATYTWEMLYR